MLDLKREVKKLGFLGAITLGALHIGSVVNEILRYKQTDRQTNIDSFLLH